MFASIREMRAKHFDWVIDLQGLARSGTFAWLVNGDAIIGVADSREGALGFYDIAVPRPTPETHAVDWYLAVAKELGVPIDRDFTWMPPRPEIQRAFCAKWGNASSRWMVINPGARWLNKRWPVEYFAELVKRLAAQDSEFRFAILGGKEDQPLGRQIAAAEPNRSLI